MIPHELEKAWAARAPHGPIYRAPNFAGERLMLGAQTEIAVARKANGGDSTPARERDARMIALLSATYGAPVSERALAYLRRALEKRTEGDALLSSTHLAMAGYWPLRDPLEAKRVFFSDGLMRRGATPATILAAFDLDPQRLDGLERFDPTQPRVPAGNGVESGRWTRDGAATGQDEVDVGDPPLSDKGSLFSENLPARIVQGLIRLAARSSIPSIVFDTLFVPSAGKSGVTEGNVPGRTDLQYRWDKPAGQVLFRVFIDDHSVTLTGGYDSLNQFYRGRDGRVIARAAGDALVVDLGAPDRAREDLAEAFGGGQAKDDSSNERSKPKLCPDPTSENTNGRSMLSIAYQQYVSGLPAELDIKLGTVRFDGCRESDGFILEAKANDYRFLAPDGQWKTFFAKGAERLSKQLIRQSDAAALAGRQVEWHVLQKPVADKIRAMIRESYSANFWWGAREESVEQCAPRLVRFLNGLEKIDAVFSDWRKGGWGGPSIHNRYCTMPLTIAEATKLLNQGREYYDTKPRTLWPELGFGTAAWNNHGDDYGVGFGVTAGAYGNQRVHANWAHFDVPRKRRLDGQFWSCAALREIMKLAIDSWDAREASIDCNRYEELRPMVRIERFERPKTVLPPGAIFLNPDGETLLCPWVGWLTYLPADLAAKVTIPGDIEVERLDDGGIIATLCDEPFTIDNPVHMARARALEAAIRPVQS